MKINLHFVEYLDYKDIYVKNIILHFVEYLDYRHIYVKI